MDRAAKPDVRADGIAVAVRRDRELRARQSLAPGSDRGLVEPHVIEQTADDVERLECRCHAADPPRRDRVVGVADDHEVSPAARTPALRARLAPTVAHSTSRRFVSRPNQLCTIAAVSSWEPLSMTTISHGSG